MRITRAARFNDVNTSVWQMNRRTNLLRSPKIDPETGLGNVLFPLKKATNIENCRRHRFRTRFWYRWIKRPGLILGRPFYNYARDYYYVGKDHIKDFQKTPIRMFLNWVVFLAAVAAYFTKGNIKDYKAKLSEKQAIISRLSQISMNQESEKYFNDANILIGRTQLGTMNFGLFTLFYEMKHGEKCKNNHAVNKTLEMGFLDKIKATIDISLFGRFWVLEWNSVDMDHPVRGLLDEPLRETIHETTFEKFIRRIRGHEKYQKLTVPVRTQRWPQGHALHTVQLDLSSVDIISDEKTSLDKIRQ